MAEQKYTIAGPGGAALNVYGEQYKPAAEAYRLGQEFGESYTRSYWERPEVVGMHYEAMRANPGMDFKQYGWDPELVAAAYDHMKQVNGGSDDWLNWSLLNPNDTWTELLKAAPPPPPEMQYQGTQFQGTFGRQLAQFLEEPTAPAAGAALPNLGLPALEVYNSLPAWQKTVSAIMANGTLQGAATMLPFSVLGVGGGLVAGGGLGAIAGGMSPIALGAAIGFAGNESTYDALASRYGKGFADTITGALQGALKVLNWPAETVERSLGVVGVLGTEMLGQIEDVIPELLWGDMASVSEAWWDSDHNVTELLEILPELWQAAGMTYESLAPTPLGQVANIPAGIEWVGDMIGSALAGKTPTTDVRFAQIGEVWIQTERGYEAVRMPLEGVAAINMATMDVMRGVPRDAVLQKYQEMYGFSGQMVDIMAQSLADPLNLMALGETKALQLVGKTFNNPALEIAAKTAQAMGEGAIGTSKHYKAALQYVTPVETMTPRQRKISGIVEGGKTIGEITPGAPPKGGGLLGNLPGIGKFWNAQNELTPVSKANSFQQMTAENFDAAMLRSGGTAEGVFDTVERWSTLAPGEVAAAGDKLPTTGAVYTAALALNDFNAKYVQPTKAIYNMGEPHRAMLGEISTALGDKWESVYKTLRSGDEAQLNTLATRLQNMGDVGAKILDQVGGVDGLKVLGEYFKANAWAVNPEFLQIHLKNLMIDNATKWAVTAYGVDKLGAQIGNKVQKFGASLKGIQSWMILNVNPGYLITNVTTNAITRMYDGTFGFGTPTANLRYFHDDLGITPWQALQAGHGMADVEAQLRTAGEVEAADLIAAGDYLAVERMIAEEAHLGLSKAARGKGLTQAINDAVGKVSNKTRLFTGLASMDDVAQSLGAHAAGTRKALSSLWSRDAMIPQIDPRIPRDIANRLMSAVEGVHRPEALDALVRGEAVPDASAFVNDVATDMGMDPGRLREALEGSGVLNDINTALKSGKTVAQAFEGAEARIRKYINKRFTQDLEIQAEAVRNLIQAEGFPAGLKIFEEVQVKLEEFWTRHFDEWERTFEMAYREGADPAVRNQLIKQRSNQADADWKMQKKWIETTYKSVADGMGIDSTISRQFLDGVNKLHTSWNDYFAQVKADRNAFFKWLNEDKKGRWDIEVRERWRTMQENHAALYDAYGAKELEFTREIGASFIEMFEKQFGVGKAVGAAEWWKAVHDLNAKRQAIMKDFRAWERGAVPFHELPTPEVRHFLDKFLREHPTMAPEAGPSTGLKHTAWPKFVEEVYLPMIHEYIKAGHDGAMAMYLDATGGRIAEPGPGMELFKGVTAKNEGAIQGVVDKLTYLTREMGPQEADAIRGLIEGNARYLGLTPDQYVARYIDDITFGGEPGEHALFKIARDDPNWEAYHEYLYEVSPMVAKDVSDYFTETMKIVRELVDSGALRPNEKTMLSFDATGFCPYTKAGRPCIYCYVEMPRALESPKASIRYEQRPYGGEIMQMPQQLVNFLNERVGGLRVFSIGDIREVDLPSLHSMCQDAQARGLKLKMITKQPETLRQFMQYDNVGINLSVDFTPEYFQTGMVPLMRERLKKIWSDTIRQNEPNISKSELKRRVAIEVEKDVRLASAVMADEGNRRVYSYGWRLDKDPTGRDKLPSAVETKAKYSRDHVTEDGTEYRAITPLYPEDKRVAIRYVAMNPWEHINAAVDPRIDVLTMFHGNVSDPAKLMDVATRQNGYLAGIGKERTAQVIADLDEILHRRGLLPEGMKAQELFDITNKYPEGGLPEEMLRIMEQKIGDDAFKELEDAFNLVRVRWQEEEYGRIMQGDVWDSLIEEGKVKEGTPAPSPEEIVKFMLGIKYKTSENAAVLRAKAARDKGAGITLNQYIDFSNGDRTSIGGNSNLQQVINTINEYTYRPALGERTTRALLSVFKEKKPGKFWDLDDPKKIAEMEAKLGRPLNPQEMFKIAQDKTKGLRKFMEEALQRPVTNEEVMHIAKTGFQKSCCTTGRCGVGCGTRCALDAGGIHISFKHIDEDLPEVYWKILNGEELASIEFTQNQRAIIRAFQESTNVFDMAHEVGHLFRRTLKPEDLKIAEEWAGVKPGEHWHTEAEEKFAAAFEEYLAKGEAPTPQLRGVFERFKQWLVDLYHSFTKKNDAQLAPEIQGVFDRMLGGGMPEPPASGPFGLGTMEGIGATPVFDSMIFEDGFNNRLRPAMDAMQAKMLAEPPVAGMGIGNLTPEQQRILRGWISQTKSEMANANLLATKIGEQMRDMSMLNFNRRYTFDNWLGTIMPYEFWPTRSLVNWSLRMLDKPGMLAFFERFSQMQDRTDEDIKKLIPTRLRGKVRIPLPGLPDGMGSDIWIDPMGKLFPYREFLRPYERITMEETAATNAAYDILRQWYKDGEITAEEYEQAKTKQGAAWAKALEMGRSQESGDMVDFMSLFVSPAMWMSIPYQLARGHPEKISQTPMSRTIQALAGAFNAPWLANLDVEAQLKQRAGISEFGEWGTYYIEKQIALMAADGLISARDAEIAMLEGEQSPLWAQAKQRVRQELAWKTPGAGAIQMAGQVAKGKANAGDMLSSILFGWLPAGLLPEGELEMRGQAQAYKQAWADYDAGNKKAIDQFFEEYPEYQARIALYREPDERLRQFMISEVWDRLFEMPKLEKRMAFEQLGPQFSEVFGYNEGQKRNYDGLTTETLAMWAQALGGQAPGMEGIPQIGLETAPAELTNAYQSYIETKNALFPGIDAAFDYLYSLPEEKQAQFKKSMPMLQQYYRWRDKQLAANPDLIQYFGNDQTKRMTPEIAQAYYNYQVDRATQFPNYSILQDQYYSLSGKSAKSSFLRNNPDLPAYWDWQKEYLAWHPEIIPYVKSQESIAKSVLGKDYKAPTTENVKPIANQMSQELKQMLFMSGYGYELPTGAYKELRYLWEKNGRPMGDFNKWLEQIRQPYQ